MAPRVRPQISMDDRFIEDPELEAMLEEWQEAKESMSEARQLFSPLDEKAKARVLGLDLATGEKVRCGRFVLSKTEQDEKSVEFTRTAKVKPHIKLLEAAG